MSTLALGSVCNGGARDRKVKAEREPCGPGVKPKMQGSRVKHTCRMCSGLFRSLLSLVACAAHANAASCAENSGMPCNYGECTFSKDGTGSLSASYPSRTAADSGAIRVRHPRWPSTLLQAASEPSSLVSFSHCCRFYWSTASSPALCG